MHSRLSVYRAVERKNCQILAILKDLSYLCTQKGAKSGGTLAMSKLAALGLH